MSNEIKAEIERVVIVTRQTELDDLVARFSTVQQSKFYIEQSGHDFDRIIAAHDAYYFALAEVRKVLPTGLKLQVVDRGLVPQYAFAATDLILVLGQDGLVSNTAKYVDRGQPILAVNPNPELYDGILLPFDVPRARSELNRILDGVFQSRDITMAKAQLSDGQSLVAFNDFFIGAKSHVSARYVLRQGDREEVQSSSGIIVSTGAGSTGWMRSVCAGAAGVVSGLGAGSSRRQADPALAWDAKQLIFAVREPFPSAVTGTSLVYGKIDPGMPLRIESQMAQNGVVFSDGMEADYMEFNTGSDATIALAPQSARLII